MYKKAQGKAGSPAKSAHRLRPIRCGRANKRHIFKCTAAQPGTSFVLIRISPPRDAHRSLRRSAGLSHARARRLAARLAAGPFIAGVLSDVWGLTAALTAMPAFGRPAPLLAFSFAARTYEADMRRAGQPTDVPASTPAAGARNALAAQ